MQPLRRSALCTCRDAVLSSRIDRRYEHRGWGKQLCATRRRAVAQFMKSGSQGSTGARCEGAARAAVRGLRCCASPRVVAGLGLWQRAAHRGGRVCCCDAAAIYAAQWGRPQRFGVTLRGPRRFGVTLRGGVYSFLLCSTCICLNNVLCK